MPSGSSLSAPTVVNGTGQLKPAPKIITESLTLVYPPIIRDYILEIAVLVVGANSKVGGLREVCALAALILGVDCMLLCTYLAAILGVMIEVSFSPSYFLLLLRVACFHLENVTCTLPFSFSTGLDRDGLFLTYCQRELDRDVDGWRLSRGWCADPVDRHSPWLPFVISNSFYIGLNLIISFVCPNHIGQANQNSEPSNDPLAIQLCLLFLRQA